MTDPILAFCDAMRAAVMAPPRVVPDGLVHRFHVEDDSNGSRNGWYVLYNDEPQAGAFGCWKRGISETWCAKMERSFTEVERERFRARMVEARKLRDQEGRTGRSTSATSTTPRRPCSRRT